VKPAASIVLFTTIAGVAQGLAVVLAVATLLGAAPLAGLGAMLWAATAMLAVALAASFFHLGHPLRAWRAALMWRTSWMSREVIVLPAFLGILGGWAWYESIGGDAGASMQWLPWIVISGAILLWYCTAMIYACIRFIQEWAHPLTVVNYVTIGVASGLVAAGALAVVMGEGDFASSLTPWAVGATALAWSTRGIALLRNARLKPKSTVQSATGIRSANVVQKSMGMTGGSFNTREFFHGAPMWAYRSTKVGFQALAFALPILLLTAGALWEWRSAWLAAWPVQFAGILAERWFFFAQAQHPQNIYYQVVS
jgi:DMSO reductase anchor subunit